MDRGAWQAAVHGTAKKLDSTEQLTKHKDKPRTFSPRTAVLNVTAARGPSAACAATPFPRAITKARTRLSQQLAITHTCSINLLLSVLLSSGARARYL